MERKRNIVRAVKWFFAFGGLLLLGALVGVASHLFVNTAPKDISYADLVVIVLTALAVMLAILGLGLAALTIVGWATFEAKLRDNSFSYFAEQLGKDGPLRRELETLLVEISLQGIQSAESEEAPSEDEEGDYVE